MILVSIPRFVIFVKGTQKKIIYVFNPIKRKKLLNIGKSMLLERSYPLFINYNDESL